MIREKKIKSGPLLEVDFFPVFADGRRMPDRPPKTKRSTKEQEKYNRTQAVKKFVRMINANFGTGDHLLHITYTPDKAPKTEAEARRDFNNCVRRVKTKRRSELKLVEALLKASPNNKRLQNQKKLLQKPLKYAYTIEKVTYQRGEYAGQDNWHFHAFFTGGLSRDDMEDIWHKGVRVNADRFQPERFGPEAAARYMMKDPQGRKRFVCSRNMDKPSEPPPRDDKITRKGVERLARERNDDKEYWERRYTGDTLTANEFWRAVIRDYYLGKGGYAYIHRENGQCVGLHYVDEQYISVIKNSDRIFKDYDIVVEGRRYKPYEFLKILRATKDGATGTPITKENSRIIDAAYRSLILERNMARRGGRKKGFLESEKRLDKESLDSLREAFARLYGGGNGYDEENFVVLNNGVKFKESTNSAVEMQLNEIKQSNADEFARIFHVSLQLVAGVASERDMSTLANLAVVPLMTTIQCALNRDLLLEKEKGSRYWAFDTKELLKGNIKERFEAYKLALDANFMQIDEVRYKEDLPELGMTWVKLGLQDVLYDPKTQRIYTPNTNQTTNMGMLDSDLPSTGEGDILEARGNDKHDPKTGRFASKSGGKSGGKGKTRSNNKKSSGRVRMSAAERTRVSHEIATDMPELKADGTVYYYFNRKHYYAFTVQETGSYTFQSKMKIEGNEKTIAGRNGRKGR